MVHFTQYLLRIKADQLGVHLKKTFIDKLRVYVKSGNGGTGVKKMGGIGGNGGNVVLQGNNALTLKKVYSNNLHKRYIAGNGENSKKLKLFGESGKDVVIEVPCGVTAVTDSGTVIGEVNENEQRLIVARGGQGGSPLNNYQPDKGTAFSVNLDLKLIADVGLIGFPNAGKSTLLSLVSRASPKIANYAFTTLNPQLGTIEYDDRRTVTVADLPGLIEGAHYNRGMGHKFLKHISRTQVNLFVVDVNGFQLNSNFEMRSAFETVVFLNKELELYDSNLVQKPSILAINKMDIEGAEAKYEQFMEKFEDYEKSLEGVEEFWRPAERVKFEKVIRLSAKENTNVGELCAEVRDIIDQLDDQRRGKNKKPVAEPPAEESAQTMVDDELENEYEPEKGFENKKSIKRLLL